MSEDIVQTGARHVDEVRAINRELTEKALRMRCLSYLAQAKANLLTQTIFEIDASKKTLLEASQETTRQWEIIARQKEELEQKNKALESFSQSVQQRLLLHREQTPLGLIEWDTYLEITDWNPSAERIFGYTRDEAVGCQLVSLVVAEEAGEEAWATWRELLINKKALHQVRENKNKKGQTRLCEWYNTPLVNEGGEVIGVASLVEDITERRQIEEAMRRAQKMEAIGQLSGGIAHDFNNQLGIIIGYLDHLADSFPEGDEPRKWVEIAARATLRCMDLTRQLLAFSRNKTKESTLVDINVLLKDMETLIARSVTPEVEVQYHLNADIGRTEIDTGEFQDAILNLVINARDAMPNGGTLLLETSNKILDEDYVISNPGVTPGNYVQLMLSDTGTGMDNETLEHVFEPFYTTKPEGKGTGLGLAMVYGFVQRYEGHIKVYSEAGVGTTIRLYLPCSTASETGTPVYDADDQELPGGSETVLIVEDEADLLGLAEQYLSDLGYRTFIAETTDQALAILGGDEEIHLLFSDVVMPGGINGYELAQKATSQRPDLKVLLTSGFTSKAINQHDMARFSTHLLSKPYRQADLARRVRHVLDQESVT